MSDDMLMAIECVAKRYEERRAEATKHYRDGRPYEGRNADLAAQLILQALERLESVASIDEEQSTTIQTRMLEAKLNG